MKWDADLCPHWLKRTFAALCGWTLVVTIDFDDDRRLRRVYADEAGVWHVRAIVGWCRLHPDGTTSGKSYVKRWESASLNRIDIPRTV